MLQAVVGARLIRRLVGFPTPLIHDRGIVLMLFLGGPVSCVVGASIGTLSLFLAGLLGSGGVAFSWFTWWVGDAIGVLIFLPLALMCVQLIPLPPAA